MYTFSYAHRVRYSECDPMGFFYHSHYVVLFDMARTEALRAIGVPYKAIEDRGIIMPVIDLSIRYRRPAHYDEMLTVVCSISEMPRTRLAFDYAVYRVNEKSPLTTGTVTLCFVDVRRDRPIRAPEVLRSAVERAVSGNVCADRPAHEEINLLI